MPSKNSTVKFNDDEIKHFWKKKKKKLIKLYSKNKIKIVTKTVEVLSIMIRTVETSISIVAKQSTSTSWCKQLLTLEK